MAAKGIKKHLGGLFSVGVFLGSIAILSRLIEMEFHLFAIVAGVLGLLAIAAAIAANFEAVVDFFRSYWIVVALGVAVLVALLAPADLIAWVGGEEWVVRVVLLLLIQGLAAGAFLLTRDKISFRSERAAVAANVSFLLQVGLGLLVAVNVIGQNWLTGALGSYDSTETKVYTLGERTRNLLDGLPGQVHATYLEFGSTHQPMPGQEPLGSRGLDFLKQYADYSPNLNLRVLKPARDKTDTEEWLRGLGIMDFDLGDQDTVIFSYRPPGAAQPNRKDVAVTGWTFLERSELGTKKFKGEELFTAAIQDVIFPKKKVYFVKGHGEPSLYGSGREVSFSQAADLVRRLALEVESVSIAEKGRVPEDADLVVIGGQRTTLLAEETLALERYLDEGGSLVLMLDPQPQLISTGEELAPRGLEAYLLTLGIVPKMDFLLMDYDLAVGSTGFGNFQKTDTILTSDYGMHGIVSALSRTGFQCRFVQACPVMVEPAAEDEGLSVEELVYVRRSPGYGLVSYAAKLLPGRDLRSEIPRVDLTGQRLPIGVAAERKTKEGEEERVTRVVVFGDTNFATTMGLSTSSPFYAPGNATLLSNAISWAVRRESLLSIEPKTLETETVVLEEREQRLAKIVGLFAIPWMVLLFGLGVAWRRRR